MGVHTTFVRSVDLDEWTQRQIDSMRLGGNANAITYFRKQGLTDMRTKIEKKYTSKAAQSYRAVLAKMVDAEAVKRGEIVDGAVEDNGKSLLEALSIVDQKEQEAFMKESRITGSVPAAAKATLASQNPNAKGTLRTPPTSGNAPKLNMLRKPTTNTVNMLKKKPSTVGGKLRVNKLTSNSTTDEGFEDVDTTVKAAAEVVAAAQPKITPAPVAPITPQIPIPVQVKPAAALPTSPVEQPKQTLEQNVAKLKAMNSDFFSMT
jgi:Putative GTPase activating protein for Arf